MRLGNETLLAAAFVIGGGVMVKAVIDGQAVKERYGVGPLVSRVSLADTSKSVPEGRNASATLLREEQSNYYRDSRDVLMWYSLGTTALLVTVMLGQMI